MVQPYNYTLGDAQDPTQSFTEGLKIADFLRQRQLQQQQREVEQQRLQDFKKAETEFYGVKGIPTMAQTLRYASYLPKDQAELIIKGRDTQSADVTKSNLSLAGQVLSSLLADNKTQAIDLVRQRVVAAKNSGDEQTSQQFDMIAKSLEAAPSSEAAFKNYAPYVSLLGEEGRKMMESVYAAQKQPSEQREAVGKASKVEQEAKKLESEAAKAKIEADFAQRLQQAGLDEKTWNVKNLQSQIRDRSQRLALDRTKVNAEIAEKLASVREKLTALPESAQKLVNEAAVEAATAKQSAQRFNTLAAELDKLPSSWGSLNSLEEWSRNQLGTQNFRSAIQAEYTRLANSAGIQAYKASGATGSMSDADLRTALEGIPKSNANPATMASFMRGMAKMQDIDASLNNAKTDWLTENKGQLGRARAGFIAGDYSVKPGETYADFSTRVSADVAKRYAPKPSGAELIPTAQPLMRPGSVTTPTQQQPAPRNIRSEADAILRGGQ